MADQWITPGSRSLRDEAEGDQWITPGSQSFRESDAAGGTPTHSVSGTIQSQRADVSGTATRTAAPIVHDVSGTFQSQRPSVSGDADAFTVHSVAGSIQSQRATANGTANTFTVHAVAGTFQSQRSDVSGSVLPPPARAYDLYFNGDTFVDAVGLGVVVPVGGRIEYEVESIPNFTSSANIWGVSDETTYIQIRTQGDLRAIRNSVAITALIDIALNDHQLITEQSDTASNLTVTNENFTTPGTQSDQRIGYTNTGINKTGLILGNRTGGGDYIGILRNWRAYNAADDLLIEFKLDDGPGGGSGSQVWESVGGTWYDLTLGTGYWINLLGHGVSGTIQSQRASVSGDASTWTVNAVAGTFQSQRADISGDVSTVSVHPVSGTVLSPRPQFDATAMVPLYLVSPPEGAQVNNTTQIVLDGVNPPILGHWPGGTPTDLGIPGGGQNVQVSVAAGAINGWAIGDGRAVTFTDDDSTNNYTFDCVSGAITYNVEGTFQSQRPTSISGDVDIPVVPVSGTFQSQRASISGTAVTATIRQVSGSIQSQRSTLNGSATIRAPFTVSGMFQSQRSSFTGTASRITPAYPMLYTRIDYKEPADSIWITHSTVLNSAGIDIITNLLASTTYDVRTTNIDTDTGLESPPVQVQETTLP